jgi:hypothetical protein
MKNKIIALGFALCFPLLASAHGPSPQKVVKEVTLKADASKVWAVVKDFGGLNKWHPSVASTKLENRKDTESDATLAHRIVGLKDGGIIVEKLREINEEEMKLDFKMVETSLAVSNYRALMQVKKGPNAGESTLVWTARFYNKANSMEAAPGEDNPAANAAINQYYDAAIVGLKKAVE